MNLPEPIRTALEQFNSGHPALAQTSEECQGAAFHSPSPLSMQEVEIKPGVWVWLCGTCRDNLKLYEEVRELFGGEIPWVVRRSFGNRLRAIGDVAQ